MVRSPSALMSGNLQLSVADTDFFLQFKYYFIHCFVEVKIYLIESNRFLNMYNLKLYILSFMQYLSEPKVIEYYKMKYMTGIIAW